MFKKDWKTTVSTVAGVAITLAGVLAPNVFDGEIQDAARETVGTGMIFVGSVINLITGIRAKDRS